MNKFSSKNLTELFNNYLQKLTRLEIAVFLLAIIIRILFLFLKPISELEAQNALIVDHLSHNITYEYSPTFPFGPLLYLPQAILQILLVKSMWLFRLMPFFCGVVSIIICIKLSKFFDKKISMCAALILAISPSHIYFSTNYSSEIYESSLFLLLFYFMASYVLTPERKYLHSMILCLFCGILLKLNFILYVLCFFLTFLIVSKFKKTSFENVNQLISNIKQRSTLKIWFVLFLVLFFLYSGFLSNEKFIQSINEHVELLKLSLENIGNNLPLNFQNLNTNVLYVEPLLLLGLLASLVNFFTDKRKWIIYFSCLSLLVVLLDLSLAINFSNFGFLYISMSYINLLILIESKFAANQKIIFNLILVISMFFTFTLFNKMIVENGNDFNEYVLCGQAEKSLNPLVKLIKTNDINRTLKGAVFSNKKYTLQYILSDFINVSFYNEDASFDIYDLDFLLIPGFKIAEVEDKLSGYYYTNDFLCNDFDLKYRVYYSKSKFKNNKLFKNYSEFKGSNNLEAFFYKNNKWEAPAALMSYFSKVDFHWEENTKPLSSPFSLKLVGELLVKNPNEKYVLETDDGGWLEIDNQRLIDDPGPHGITALETILMSEPGWKNFAVGFYDNGAGAILKLFRINENGDKEIVPKESFRLRGDS